MKFRPRLLGFCTYLAASTVFACSLAEHGSAPPASSTTVEEGAEAGERSHDGPVAREEDVVPARPRDRADAATLDGADAEADADAQADAGPAFPYDPEVLVFAARAGDGGTSFELFTVRSDGAELKQLTDTPGHEESYPRWSPDRSEIAYVRDGELWVMKADGQNARMLASVGPLSPPAWSPDGTQLLYARPLAPCYDPENPIWNQCIANMHVATIAGGDQVYAYGQATLEPTWLNDGRVVMFDACLGDGCPGGLFGFFVLGAGVAQTSPSSWPHLEGLYWGPDVASIPIEGHGLAFTSDATRVAFSSPTSAPVHQPWMWSHYDQTGPLALCERSGCTVVVDASDAWLPRWSPQEDRLGYLRADGIYVKSVGGASGQPHRILAISGARGLDW